MEYIEKATLAENKKKLNIIKISVIATVCVFAFVMGIYNLFWGSILFAVLYFIAIIPGAGYVVIKINSVMPVYIAIKDNKLYMQCWENRAFAYKIESKFGFLTDFVPETVIVDEIPIPEIDGIFVGSRAYLVRNLEGTSFEEETDKIILNRRTEKNQMRKMDFVCVVMKDNNIFYMPVTDMDMDALAKIINYVHRANEQATIKCNLKILREKLTYDKN